jgi:tripeptidyl-peptidase-1
MKSCILFLVSAFVASVIAAPASSYTIHERRNAQSASKWAKRDEPLDRRAIVPVKIALTQRNLDNGHDWLMDVSDPSSENYGKHWTTEKVAETFAAEETTITTVTSWLTSSGISEDRITVSNSKSWIRMDLTIAEAESLLKTEYKMFEHTETSKRSLAVEEYSIPARLFNILLPRDNSSHRSLLGSQRLLRCKSWIHLSLGISPTVATTSLEHASKHFTKCLTVLTVNLPSQSSN